MKKSQHYKYEDTVEEIVKYEGYLPKEIEEYYDLGLKRDKYMLQRNSSTDFLPDEWEREHNIYIDDIERDMSKCLNKYIDNLKEKEERENGI